MADILQTIISNVFSSMKIFLNELKTYSGNVFSQTWSKPIMENLKVPWNMQKIGQAWAF